MGLSTHLQVASQLAVAVNVKFEHRRAVIVFELQHTIMSLGPAAVVDLIL